MLDADTTRTVQARPGRAAGGSPTPGRAQHGRAGERVAGPPGAGPGVLRRHEHPVRGHAVHRAAAYPGSPDAGDQAANRAARPPADDQPFVPDRLAAAWGTDGVLP